MITKKIFTIYCLAVIIFAVFVETLARLWEKKFPAKIRSYNDIVFGETSKVVGTYHLPNEVVGCYFTSQEEPVHDSNS